MAQVLQSVLLLSGVGGVLTGVLLLLKPFTGRAFGPRWQYCVWLCVLAVMLLPVRFDLPIRAVLATQTPMVQTVPENAAVQVDASTSSDPVVQSQIQPVTTPATPRFAPALLAFLPSLWLLGALLSLFLSFLQYLRFLRLTRSHSRSVECPALDAVKMELKIRRTVRVRCTDCTTAPLTVGLFWVTLLLPGQTLSENNLRDVLRHELTHMKRYDIACKWFALLVRSVHWFNPLVYFACKQMDEACEVSCDLAVTDSMDETEKRGYMRTILSLASPQRAMRLGSSMAGSKAQIERRFTMIQTAKRPSRFVSALSVMTAIALLTTSVFASGVAAGAVGDDHTQKTSIEVYDGTAKVSFTNQPFIENDEVYLPLRETLNQFGVTDLRWDAGKVDIALPLADNYKGGGRQEHRCRIVVGSATIWYGEQSKDNGYLLRYAPMVKDGVTYATVELFENLAFHGQMPDFRVHLKQSSDPKDYFTQGEEVYIGTGEEQDQYHPVDKNGNRRSVKRIVTNEQGEAMYVVTVENQSPEKIASMNAVNSSSMQGYTKGSEGRSRTFYMDTQGTEILFSSGIFVYERTGENEFADIAYIPPALQINCCAYNPYKLMD